MVGDPWQLPPLIKSRVAKEGGADISLMERLSNQFPKNLKQLKRQYRFNQSLTDLANHLRYEGKMEADESIKNSSILDVFNNWNLSKIKSDWVKRAIDPESSVIFINTEAGEKLEKNISSKGYVNETETKIISQLVEHFSVMKIKKDCIGIIAPYRAQIELLNEKMAKFEGVEINTVDKFQGRENKIIILSFVRSRFHLEL